MLCMRASETSLHAGALRLRLAWCVKPSATGRLRLEHVPR
jgi:hypothetical protein